MDVATRTVFGYEALARGPEGTELHSPAALFATAERAGPGLPARLPVPAERRSTARAICRAAPKLFLNVRPTTIHDPNFRADALERTLERCQLAPDATWCSRSPSRSRSRTSTIFREVRDYYGKLGFQIALDDTGAGYASLEAVMELAPDFIKVDRAFVRRDRRGPGAPGPAARAAIARGAGSARASSARASTRSRSSRRSARSASPSARAGCSASRTGCAATATSPPRPRESLRAVRRRLPRVY